MARTRILKVFKPHRGGSAHDVKVSPSQPRIKYRSEPRAKNRRRETPRLTAQLVAYLSLGIDCTHRGMELASVSAGLKVTH